ncbi:MAG: lipoate protein ligase C-terminal domain-containing protein [Candidatus Diapherotrites archaeon]
MQGKSIYKIPEGKLLKVFLEFNENKINSVKLTGDFFLHPEEGIELIESSLKEQEFNKEKLIQEINKVVEENNLVLFGLNAEGITEAIFMAKEAGK